MDTIESKCSQTCIKGHFINPLNPEIWFFILPFS